MTPPNVTPIRPESVGTEERGARPHEAVGRAVARLVTSGRSGSVRLWIGSAQIGRLDVHEGRVRHAEIPGARGDVALGLVPRLLGVHAVIEEYRPVASTVTVDWRTVLDPDGELEQGVTTQPLEPDGEPEHDMTTKAPEPEADLGRLFQQATAAYVARRYDEAQALFERCAELAPDDRFVAHNLERMRKRRR